ncbi:MAG: aminotransferase class I/II-fold pyridoxal phosphate-dependent enzyme [Cellvibrionales bacterium]|nr:aminotransferase class I/II-fold pyridoxal phosphate-dependent enzyme [Cellvibrionales bacterium]
MSDSALLDETTKIIESTNPSESIKENVQQAVIEAFAKESGYTTDELSLDAHLENELGIDSITLVSAIADLQKAFGLPENTQQLRFDNLTAVVAYFIELLADAYPEGNWQAPTTASSNNVSIEADEIIDAITPEAKTGSYQADDDLRTMQDFVNIEHPDLFYKTREFKNFYQKKKANNLYWYGMPLESACKNRATIYDEVAGKSREFLMFGSNSYLGLSAHPKVIDAIADAAKSYGATNTGCRIIAGSNVLHLELERKLAELKGREAAIVYPSGYSANLGAISALAGRNDLVFTDAINHMSILDGCKLSGAKRKIYNHSMASLETTLAKSADHKGGKLIVTDGVFSMHGDIVDLPRLVQLAKQYDAKVLVDDAHSTGVLGKTGSGTTEHFNMKGEVDLELGTMSKALSGMGGFVCGDGDVVEYLRFYSNSYVFAATIPAPCAAGIIASIDIMRDEPERLKGLWDNIHYFRAKLLKLGFDLEKSESAIIPIVVGDDQLTLTFGRAVRARGMYCQTVVFPGVAVGDARLRISVTCEHTIDDLDQAVEILVDSAQEVGVIVTV